MKLPGIHCTLHSVELHKSITNFPAVLLVSGLLLGINAAQAAMFSINFYEQTGNINENGHNFIDDYTFVGGGPFEITDSAVASASSSGNPVMFSDAGFLTFIASISGLSTGDSSTFILGTDDFEEGETNERGLLFDSSGAPIRFDQPTTTASGDRTMCVSGPTSCDGVTLNNLTRLTLIDNDVFQGIYLDDGTVTTLSSIGSGESYTPFGGNWTYFSGTNVGSGIEVGGFYTITAVPVPAAIWLFCSGILGLIGMARRKNRSN